MRKRQVLIVGRLSDDEDSTFCYQLKPGESDKAATKRGAEQAEAELRTADDNDERDFYVTFALCADNPTITTEFAG